MKQNKEEKDNLHPSNIYSKKGKEKASRQTGRQTFCFKSSKVLYIDLFRLAKKITQSSDRSIHFYLVPVKDKAEPHYYCY